MGSVSVTEKCYKEKLIRSVKKEVKAIMEEAVTRKFVHEDSASITSLCAAVEACVSHGLKRRALGLFKSSSTTALLHKVAKSFQPAARIVQLVHEIENCDPNKRSSSGSESASKIGIGIGAKPPLQKRNSVAASAKYLWIRTALVEKQLAKIIDYIVQNNSKYYEKDALVADSDYGSILSSLLVGPCALDFSKLRTGEHLWTDPPADELVQRHRISSGHFPVPASPPTHKRPGLHYKGSSVGFSNSDDNQRSKDYVESLHQNNKSTLLYGKNNVIVYLKDASEPLAGYLSLHQCGELLNLKWTPNQLMNGCNESIAYDKTLFWQYALNVVVHEIVYVHCHQGPESDWIVLVGQDGVQRPPIHFPRGGHLLAFLSCLENGLLPHGTLDPPLWSQRGKAIFFTDLLGKVFPKLRRKGSRFYSIQKEESVSEEIICEQQNTSDFVFRIVYPNFSRTFPQIEEMFDEWKVPGSPKSSIPPTTPRSTPLHSVSTTSSTSSSKSLDQQPSIQETGEPIQVVCQTMRKQIISRAFYGWLAHCRHLRTIRTHLVGLVRQDIIKAEEPEDALGLTEERWKSMQEKGPVDLNEVYRLVYFGGMAPSLRRKLWPIMLSGNVQGDDPAALKKEYEDKMSEWLAVEAIVRQRDRETMAANLAKLSSEGGTLGETQHPSVLQTHGSNEVFEDNVSIDSCSSAVETSSKPEDAKGGGGENNEKEKEKPKENESPKEKEMEKGERVIPGAIKSALGSTTSASSSPLKSSSRCASSTSSPVSRTKKVSFSDGEDKVDRIQTSLSSSPVISAGIGLVKKYFERVELNGNKDKEKDKEKEKEKDKEKDKENGNSTEAEEAVEKEEGAQEPEQVTNHNDKEKADSKEEKEEKVENGNVVQENGNGVQKDRDNNNKDAGGGDDDSLSSDDSPASSSRGGVYSNELLEVFGLNLHRIDKDVKRCDRNYWYFTEKNLEKLKNVICTYVWENMEIGYVQGMCDLAAPLLVILDDEAEAYICFRRLMERMSANFPTGGGAMDTHFANMRSLLQVLDHDLFALIRQNGDYTHFYFCYRWFLLDFKREFCYDDVFLVWESIWASRHVASADYGLFLALALLNYYRDIILANNMDFTDIIKFFNEMAERHDARVILRIARSLVLQLQTLIENK